MFWRTPARLRAELRDSEADRFTVDRRTLVSLLDAYEREDEDDAERLVIFDCVSCPWGGEREPWCQHARATRLRTTLACTPPPGGCPIRATPTRVEVAHGHVEPPPVPRVAALAPAVTQAAPEPS